MGPVYVFYHLDYVPLRLIAAIREQSTAAKPLRLYKSKQEGKTIDYFSYDCN
jgi:hypothetical protein